jgi:hypothetical protein
METRDSDNSYAASGSPIKASTKNAALQRGVSHDFGQIVGYSEVGPKRAWGTSIAMSAKRTSGQRQSPRSSVASAPP